MPGDAQAITLDEMLAGVELAAPVDVRLARTPAAGLDYDSRRVAPGFLFFAFAGERVDGRRFVRQALERGAIAVASELGPPEAVEAPWIRVAHGRRALAAAARNFYHAPDARIGLTGITGTNGKTTTAWVLDAILRSAGKPAALAGTIEHRIGERRETAVNTTPESLDLFRMLDALAAQGGTHATFEVSSHALALGRVAGMNFHTAVFTNLSQDHLDFHRNMEDYFAAKQLLFSGPPAPRFAVINADDEWGRRLRFGAATSPCYYGIRNEATLRASRIESTFQGLRFVVTRGFEQFPVVSPLIGEINVYNVLAAFGAALTYGLEPGKIVEGIAACRGVPGRFEQVEEGQEFLVVVDYAHTPDALRNVIAVAHSLTRNRVITLFGCGGDRDRAKRPLMGQAAGEASDFVVATSDNPRSEDPLRIIEGALAGLMPTGRAHHVEPDRERAIRYAIEHAEPGDVVIIAGKGHEPYQELASGKIAFDDREVARRALRALGYRQGAAAP